MKRKLIIAACACVLVIVGYLVSVYRDRVSVYTPQEFRSLPYTEQKQYISSLASHKPVEAWKLLTDTFIVNGKTVQNIHELAHIVGNGLYTQYGFEGITYCTTSFSYGCFHGVTEEGLSHTGPQELMNIENACISKFPPLKGDQYQSCIHGTGHGLLGFEGGDMTKALNDCDMLDPNYRSYCYDGVFMENAGENEETGVVFDAAHPWAACTGIEEKYEINCARYQVPVFLRAGGKDPITIAGTYCSRAPKKTLASTCYENLGYFVAQQSVGNAERVQASCSELKEGKEQCIAGAGIESVFQGFATPDYSKVSLCDTINEPLKTYCKKRIDSISR